MHVPVTKGITAPLVSKLSDLTERIPRAFVLAMVTLLPTIDVTLRISLTPLLDFPVSATRVGFPTLATMHVPVKLVLIHHVLSAPLGITYLTEAVLCALEDPSRVLVT